MKLLYHQTAKNCTFLMLFFTFLFLVPSMVHSFSFQQNKNTTTTKYIDLKGKVVDAKSGDGISSAQLMIEGSNISTVTNSEGEFILKIPSDLLNSRITVSFLGY